MIRTTVFTFCAVALFSVITETKSHGVIKTGGIPQLNKTEGTFKQDCECGISPVPIEARIVNGQVRPLNRYPWMVVIFYDGMPWCGGTLISHNFVLTAAHCFDRGGTIQQYTIGVMGHSSILTKSKDIVHNRGIFLHPDYNWPVKFENDIALIQLDRPVECSIFRRPICLAGYGVPDLGSGQTVIFTGWDQYGRRNSVSHPLLETTVIVQPRNDCLQNGTRTHICAVGLAKEGCMDDSGGSLMAVVNGRYYNYGVVSYGGQSCFTRIRPFFSEVKLFNKWIHEIMRGRT